MTPSAPLHAWSAAELAAAYRRRALSPVEVVEAVLTQIERCEPTLQALWRDDPMREAEAARTQARDSEARFARGEPRSALDGVPATLKENIATAGCPLPLGSAATLLAPAAADAPPAARLREAGCVLVGKTTMPDYGMLSSGLSSFHGARGVLTKNPWDLRLNPGGSSAGAGAAAAAGYGPLHVGTDIGGSIRLPAGWCGVFGFKPSHGRVPIHPPYAGRVAGPMTRSVEDAALMMAELSRPDARDTMSLPYQRIDWGAIEGLDLRGLRVGLWLDAGWGLPLDAEHAAAVNAAAHAFEREGAIVEPLAPWVTREMADGVDRFWRVRSWLDLQALPAERRERVLPYIRAWAEGAAGATAAELFHGYTQMAVTLREATAAACRPFDLVLSPVSPVPPFPADWAGPTNDPARAMEHIGFTLPFNMSEQPAASIDAGRTRAGLPIGLQIAGPRHADLAVLRAARAWERMRAPLPVLPALTAGG